MSYKLLLFWFDIESYGKLRLDEECNDDVVFVIVFWSGFVVVDRLVVVCCRFYTDEFIFTEVCLLIYGLNTFYCVIIFVCVTFPVT